MTSSLGILQWKPHRYKRQNRLTN